MTIVKNSYILIATLILLILTINTCTQESCDSSGEVVSRKTVVDSVRTHFERYIDSTDVWVKHSYSDVPAVG